ncbi:hypothetical protein DEIPH_ctg021orf0015 [Deinococcus phoenicis]|uniref:Uncharacterized protein n=1 Tax=Deinococcus phoenicis TaxID=1476583 RepID=A0A016QR04_9DEIO|nr:hypothetical protein [Deinococcus phoenicis]EYB68508.1 hypothetical protein DEIPH_ctg021orf0015 [Deinococcus phoenicis]
MTYWAELVELYEYRVADALEGRLPRGGRGSLAYLRDVLFAAPLEPALSRRLLDTDRQYRTHLKRAREEGGPVSRSLPPPPPPPAARATWTAPAPGSTPEARAWEEVQRLVWFADLRTRLLHLGRTLQTQPERLSLRVLYTAVENADRDARGVTPALAVPPVGDSLVSLHDPEVVRDLMLALAERLLTPEGRARFLGALGAVQEAPFPRHADADVLAARIQAAGREPLAPEAREALVQALRAPYPQENRDPRERPAIREAARQLQQTLETLLEDAPGPGLGVTLAHSILYAGAASAALPAPDDAASELVIHLAGGEAARWRGLDFRWQPVGPNRQDSAQEPNWQMLVEGPDGQKQVVLLRPGLPAAERVLTLNTPHLPLRLALSGAYLLLQAGERPAEQLGRLAAQARAAARLLDPEGQYANLRLARAAAQALQGEPVDAAALGPASAAKYAAADPDTLLAFARRGVGALTTRLSRLTPAEVAAALSASAAALGLPTPRAQALHEALHAATFIPERLPEPYPITQLELPGDGRFVSVTLGDDPVTLQARGRALTLRDDQGSLAVLLPGQPPVPLADLLVLRVPGAHLLLVRQGRWLAAAEVRTADTATPPA